MDNYFGVDIYEKIADNFFYFIKCPIVHFL